MTVERKLQETERKEMVGEIKSLKQVKWEHLVLGIGLSA